MSRPDWKLAIEVVGIASIVISLALVATELKQNQDMQIAQVHSTRTDRTIELGLIRSQLKGFELQEKAAEGASLTDLEFANLRLINLSYMWHFEDLYFQRRLGLINDETWEAKLAGLKSILNDPTFKLLYPELVRTGFLANFEKSFIELVNSLQQ